MSSKTTKNKQKLGSDGLLFLHNDNSPQYYMHWKQYIFWCNTKVRFIEAQIIAGVLGTHDHYNKPTRAQWYVLKKKQLEYIRKWLTKEQNLKITEIYMQLMHQGPKRIISQVKIKKQK